MTEEKLKKSYTYGYSHGRAKQPKKTYTDAENSVEKYLSEFKNCTVYKEKILPKLRKFSDYEDYQGDESYTYPPSGVEENLLSDSIESFYMGMEDALRDRGKLKKIDHR